MGNALSAPRDTFRFTPLAIKGAWLIEPTPMRDDRGHFLRTFCADEFAKVGLETDFVQRSASFNARRGTLRGLHFQAGAHAETKIVRCVRGAVFDVLVDLRPDEPTFGKFFHAELRPDRATMLYIPKGCAHGFLTLENASEVYYEITPAYRPQASAGVFWNDPALAIPWPFPPVMISAKDQMLPTAATYFSQARASRADV